MVLARRYLENLRDAVVMCQSKDPEFKDIMLSLIQNAINEIPEEVEPTTECRACDGTGESTGIIGSCPKCWGDGRHLL